MKYDFSGALASANLGAGDSRYKFAEGDNKLRVLSEFVELSSTFPGESKPNTKFVCYVVDRKDENKVKLAFLPKTIYKAILELATSEEFPCDEIPMTYDIIVKAKNAGTKEVEYQTIPSPKVEPVTPDILERFALETPVAKVVEQIKAQQGNVEPDSVDTSSVPMQ